MLESLRFRLMQRDELFRLKRIYRLNDSKLDPTDLLTAAVVENVDSTIVGVAGFELIPHVGPLWVDESLRGNGIAGKLFKVIEDELNKTKGTGYYSFPSNDISKRVMEKLGLEKLPVEVWKREF
jgi:GNAT superfamily N-acetyltransferase